MDRNTYMNSISLITEIENESQHMSMGQETMGGLWALEFRNNIS